MVIRAVHDQRRCGHLSEIKAPRGHRDDVVLNHAVRAVGCCCLDDAFEPGPIALERGVIGCGKRLVIELIRAQDLCECGSTPSCGLQFANTAGRHPLEIVEPVGRPRRQGGDGDGRDYAVREPGSTGQGTWSATGVAEYGEAVDTSLICT